MGSIPSIENSLKTLRSGDTIAYRQSIGSGYYVSLSTKIYCIDIRRFFLPYGETDVKPAHQGIALRLCEWDGMKIVYAINNAYPSLGTALPCYLADNHQNQIGALQCRECNPYTTDSF